MAMDGERTSDTSPVLHPDEVQWRFAVIPLLLSVLLVASVLAYRCRAHRLRRERLEREQDEERRELTCESLPVGKTPGIWYQWWYGGVRMTCYVRDLARPRSNLMRRS